MFCPRAACFIMVVGVFPCLRGTRSYRLVAHPQTIVRFECDKTGQDSLSFRRYQRLSVILFSSAAIISLSLVSGDVCAQVTVGLRVPISEEENGMEITRKNSFLSTGKQGSNGGGNQQGMDAVRRAIAKAHLGVDDSFYAGSISRSQQSSRAGSLNSKNGDLSAATVEAVSNWKHEIAWGGTHTYNPRLERRIGPTAQVFGRPQRKATVGPVVVQNRSKAETAAEGANADTPCVDRGPWVGFNGHSVTEGSRGVIAEYDLPSTSGQPEGEGKRPDDGDTVYRREEEKIERTPPLSDSVVLGMSDEVTV